MEQCRNYYSENKEAIKEKVNIYRKAHPEEIKERKRKYQAEHAEQIKAHKGKQCICACGATYTHGHKLRHERTQKHIRLMEQLQKEQEN